MSRLTPLLLLFACQGTGTLEMPLEPLSLEVTSPTYAQFLGDAGRATVTGTVNDPNALVWVEGYAVNLGTDGSFAVEVPVDGPYRILDVEAANPTAHLRERIPVFLGNDPMETYPGALPLRLTPIGLGALGDSLEPTVDELGIDDAISGLLPAIDAGDFVFTPLGLTRDPTDVVLVGQEDGLYMDIYWRNVVYEADYEIPLLGGGTLEIGFEEIVLGIAVAPEVDDQGVLGLAFGDSTVSLTDPILQTSALDPVILEDLLAGTLAGLGDLIADGLDLLLGAVGSISLGAPIDFELDLLGTSLTVGIDDLYADEEGLALVLGLGIGEDTPKAPAIVAPTAADGHFASHAVLSVHEGLFQALLASDLLELLTADLELGGMLGGLLDLPVRALPGGEAVPPEANGWCLSLDPGDARVVRMTEAQDPLAVLYLPDLQLDVGYTSSISAECTPWLLASLAVELGVGLDDAAALTLDLDVAEGAVLSYATTAPWQEQEVIAGLSGLLSLVDTLLGGGLGDLGGLFGSTGTGTGTGTDLLGLGLGELTILEVSQARDAEGEDVEGLRNLSMRLFD